MKTTLIAVAAALPLMAQEGAPQPPAPEVASVPAAVCAPAQPPHHAGKPGRHHRPQAAQQPIVIVVQCPCAGNRGAAPAPKPCCGAKPEGKPGCGAPAPKPCCGAKPEGKPGCGAPAPKPGAAEKGLPPFLAPFDLDKDGKLSPEEAQEARKAMKARHEASMQARREARQKFEAERREARQKKMAERRDAFRKRVLEKFDTNKDGKLDEQELAAWKAAQRAAWNKMLLDKYDTNKDGKLDEEETAAMKADWARTTAEYQRSHGMVPRVPVPAPVPAPAPAPAPEAPAPAPEAAPAPAPEAPAPATEG